MFWCIGSGSIELDMQMVYTLVDKIAAAFDQNASGNHVNRSLMSTCKDPETENKKRPNYFQSTKMKCLNKSISMHEVST